MFSLSINEGRRKNFEFISQLLDYQGLSRASIIDAGLSLIIANDQQEKNPHDVIDLFMSEDEIYKYMNANKDNNQLDEKMKQWVRIFNAINTMNQT